MDFKSILNKLDSMETPAATPAAPQLPKAVQLNEDAQLRVLAGQSTYKNEASKLEVVSEVFDKDAQPGDTKKTSKGVATKTKTGLVHKSTKDYGGSEEKDDSDDEKKAKKESIDPTAFKSKFDKMVEAKKGSKPDFLDMDKDGDKKEPMKKAVADKKKGAVKEEMKVGDKKASSTGGTIEKTKTGLKHTAGNKYSGKEAEKESKDKKVDEGKDEGKPGKNFAKIAKKAAKEYGSKAAGERVAGAVRKKVLAKESKMVAESVEQKLTFKQMVQLVQESGGQQAIDPVDTALFAWAQRVATNKLGEGMKAELYAGLIYERNGGVFEMYDVLSEAQK